MRVRVARLFDGIAGRKRGSTLENLTVFIDSRVPRWMWPGLVVHEWSELKYEGQGHKYPGSHQMATADERKFIGEKRWSKYNGIYLKLIKIIEKGPKGKDPADMYYGHTKGPVDDISIDATSDIGDRWAARISDEFQAWSDQAKKTGKYDRTIKIAPFDPSPQIAGAFYESSEAQLTEIGKLIGMGVKFDLRSPEAEAWIKAYGAQQIKYINIQTRQTIQQITLKGLQEGLIPAEQSKLIRQNIGLLPQHYVAVQNYQAALLSSGTDETIAQKMADEYAAKLLTYRSDMIGRTEGMAASNEGTRKTNEDAVARGIIDPDEYEQEWLGQPDACEMCREVMKTRAPIGGTFKNGSDGPPIHPHDKCTTILVVKRE